MHTSRLSRGPSTCPWPIVRLALAALWLTSAQAVTPKPAEFAADSQTLLRQWDTLYRWVQKQYSPATVRALSGWAQKQMAAYKRTPGLKGLPFVPIRVRQDQKKLVFEAVAGSLPVHDKTVTRYLKIFLLYDSGESKIVKVTITIRGELSE